MRIKLITVGKIKEKSLVNLIENYTKQMGQVEIIEIPDIDDSNGIEKEGKQILSKIQKDEHVVSLAIEGKTMDSIEFSQYLDKVNTHQTSRITFIIGGSYGLSDEVKKKSELLLSFSKMTFPHQLMRLILIEQIYRAQQILKKHPYHK
ncbi:MAG TPA: 23S rRNA (pseudouridine(1915)-N(3))-methyltransferase RlmH [Acholeplasma sp.]|nr:23S rRNA (pseudouridine(1915)-N(3))-methyltransferase RlmH [Acholeplasma sp.]